MPTGTVDARFVPAVLSRCPDASPAFWGGEVVLAVLMFGVGELRWSEPFRELPWFSVFFLCLVICLADVEEAAEDGGRGVDEAGGAPEEDS